MPMTENELQEVRGRVLRMFMDTIATFEKIEENADAMYGERAPGVRAAIREYLNDFILDPGSSGEKHPEVLIYQTSQESFQRAGFYGAQLNLKEKQVTTVNRTLRERLSGGVRAVWNRPFKKWVDVINNFLSSFAPATGLGEALKELKDCLRDELPDDDNG
jgi:hypothetical protein